MRGSRARNRLATGPRDIEGKFGDSVEFGSEQISDWMFMPQWQDRRLASRPVSLPFARASIESIQICLVERTIRPACSKTHFECEPLCRFERPDCSCRIYL